MKKLISLLVFSLLLGKIWANIQGVSNDTLPVGHALWDSLLHRHVQSDGFVNYKGMIADSAALNQYLARLSAAQPDSKNWTRAEKMAFWINAYNAFTVKLIVDHYPVGSIRDIKRGVPGGKTVWDKKFIRIDGKQYDLNKIEHGILRPDFKDARVHAAINCASYSCPVLRNEAFVAEKLEQQLDDAMRKFINDPLRNRVSGKKAEISEIFNWFQDDFVRDAGSVRAYLNRFAHQKLSAVGQISYQTYRWDLNGVK